MDLFSDFYFQYQLLIFIQLYRQSQQYFIFYGQQLRLLFIRVLINSIGLLQSLCYDDVNIILICDHSIRIVYLLENCKIQILKQYYFKHYSQSLHFQLCRINQNVSIKYMCRLSSILSWRVVSDLKYIQGDVSLRYDTEYHNKWIYYFVIPDLMFFGYLIPLCLFVLLYAQRNKLDSIRLRGHICYLFNEYNQDSYFWELIKLSKKAAMIFIMTYFETNISLKATLLGLCLVLYQLIAIRNKPYIISKFNALDLYSGQLCSISIFLAAAKYNNEQQNDIISSIALQVLLIIFCFRLCQPYLVDIIRIYNKKYKVLFFTKLNKILKFIKLEIIAQFLDNWLLQMKFQELQLQRNLNKLRSLARSQVTNRRLITSQINSQWTYRFRQNSPDVEHKSLVPLVTD